MKKLAISLVGTLLLLQLVPFGRDHKNPAVRREPVWDQPRTRELAVRACFDCHSNQTKWPWYSSLAPISWLVQHDVEEGRQHLNFSTWDLPQKDVDEAVEAIEEGEMPMLVYLPLHPEARLSAAEQAELVRGLEVTLSADPPPKSAERDDHD